MVMPVVPVPSDVVVREGSLELGGRAGHVVGRQLILRRPIVHLVVVAVARR